MQSFGSVRPVRLLWIVLLLGMWPTTGSAQGSVLYTHSACMSARNGAGIAHPCQDGSAVYYNPAALARQNGAVGMGATMIEQSGSFIYDTTGAEIERAPRSVVLPHGWATYRLSPRLGVGLGVWAPYGMSVDWPVCPADQPRCGTGFEGRFVGYDQSLRGLYLQPTVAWDLVPGRLAIGGGVDLVKADLELNRRLDLSPQPVEIFPGVTRSFADLGMMRGTDFADVRVSGDGWGVTGHVGALVQVTRAISLGLRYLHSVELALEGAADFTQLPTSLTIGPLGEGIPAGTRVDELLAASGVFDDGGALGDQDVSTTVTLPAQAVAGIAIQVDPTLRILLDYQWTQWSVWDTIVVAFANEGTPAESLVLDYQDATTVRFGVDYAISDRVAARGGFSLAEAAARDASVSPFLPDSERALFSGGIHYRASERLSLDLFAMTVRAADRRGRVVDRGPGLTPEEAQALNEGVYSAEGQMFGATVTYHFGGPR